MKHSTAELRATLDQIQRVCNWEMSNLSLCQCWPMIAKLIEANTYPDADMRGLAMEHFVDDLVKTLGETRRHINATNRWLADQERKAAAKKAAAKPASNLRSLVG
jgi:hypothetical protein